MPPPMVTRTASRYDYWRPKMYPKQEAAMFCPERIGVIEAATKAGKTVSAMAWLLEQAVLGPPHANYSWVAPVYGQAKIPFDRYKRDLPRGTYDVNEGEVRLTLPNRSRIWFKGSEKWDALYGEDIYAAVIDEATRCREEAWIAVRATLTATRGPVRVIGNVRGRKNWAYKLARRAESGEPNMHYAKITALDAVDAGVLEAEEIDEARRVLPDHAFRELYLAEAADNTGNPFGDVDVCLGPVSSASPVAWGWDLAKAVDWTVGIGLDSNGQVCRFLRFQRPWGETRAVSYTHLTLPTILRV